MSGGPGGDARQRRGEPTHGQAAPVAIELTEGQIDLVVRTAGGQSRPMAALWKAVRDDRWREGLTSDYQSLQADRRLAHSLLAGLFVLACVPADGGYIGVVEVARRLNMNTSTAHRYVVTLLAAGLIERDANTRKYRLAAWSS
jgi:predicted transcriptional regulator